MRQNRPTLSSQTELLQLSFQPRHIVLGLIRKPGDHAFVQNQAVPPFVAQPRQHRVSGHATTILYQFDFLLRVFHFESFRPGAMHLQCRLLDARHPGEPFMNLGKQRVPLLNRTLVVVWSLYRRQGRWMETRSTIPRSNPGSTRSHRLTRPIINPAPDAYSSGR